MAPLGGFPEMALADVISLPSRLSLSFPLSLFLSFSLSLFLSFSLSLSFSLFLSFSLSLSTFFYSKTLFSVELQSKSFQLNSIDAIQCCYCHSDATTLKSNRSIGVFIFKFNFVGRGGWVGRGDWVEDQHNSFLIHFFLNLFLFHLFHFIFILPLLLEEGWGGGGREGGGI